MSKYIETLDMFTLPLVSLRGIVIFPKFPTAFDLTDKSAIRAIRVAQETNSLVFITSYADINAGSTEFCPMGIIARIKQAVKVPDGNFRVLVEGKYRAEIQSLSEGREYIKANVIAKDVSVSDAGGVKGEALIREAQTAFDKFAKALPKLSNDVAFAVKSIREPGLLADFIAVNVFYKFSDKQAILDETDPLRRLETVIVVMERETEILELELDIHNKVKSQIDQNQREYYLREQLKAIQNELGGDEKTDVEEYAERMEALNLPEDIAERLNKELAKLEKMPYSSAESTVLRNYLDICLEFPWNVRTKERCNVSAAQKILDADHDGLQKVKDRILEHLAVRQMAPDVKGQILCLVGPPGVGKSSIATSVARAMNRNFVRVSLGGVRDEADIRGHRKTYVASMPGRIVNGLIRAECVNPVMLLDEIDKLTSNSQGDPASALLEVLDPEQNKTFRDHFLEIPVDLSECVFIATANTLDTVPKPLLDRMEVIRLDAYTRQEKLSIFKNHLFPKQLKRHGLTKRNIRLSEDAIHELIDFYTKEAGVRSLERETASLCRKVARKMVETGITAYRITADNLKDYIGKRKVLDDSLQTEALIGVVNGLDWTEVGGEILQVEVASMEGTGKVELTGSLGDVMKESAKAAITVMRSHADRYGIDPEFYKNRDIHIHFPEGATPKDGPSAGVTMSLALYSELTGNQVRSDVAMTGEITLRGRVLPIGGLKEKSMAAYKHGIKTVIIPYGNLPDIDDVDPVVKSEVQFCPVKTFDDVLDIALVSPLQTGDEEESAILVPGATLSSERIYS